MNIRLNKELTPIIIVLLFITSCATDDNPDDLITKKLYLKRQTITWTFSGHHDTTESVVSTQMTDFEYDTAGRVIKAGNIEFIYDSEDKLIATLNDNDTIHYYWNGNQFAAIVTSNGYYDGGSYSDTTTFRYLGDELLYSLSSHDNTKTQYMHNNQKLVAKYITHTEAGTDYCDSLLYKWKDGNLIAIQTCSSFPWNAYLYVREFNYDKQPSWMSLINYPAEYLFVREITQFYSNYPLFYYEVLPWRYNCVNNPIEFTERTKDQVKVTPFHVSYNKEGYPLSIHGKNFSMVLEYSTE